MNVDQHLGEFIDDSGLKVTEVGPGRLVLAGELDRMSAATVADAVATALLDPGPPALELDVAELIFLDAAGIRALLGCREHAERAGRRLVLVTAPGHVRLILEITGLLDTFGLGDGPTRGGGLTSDREARPSR